MNNIDLAVELAVIAARLAELLTDDERQTYNDQIGNL